MKHQETKSEHYEKPPVSCSRNRCAANKKGICLALKVNDFVDGSCPFFKTSAQNKHESQMAIAHLVEEGRLDLIDKYYIPERE